MDNILIIRLTAFIGVFLIIALWETRRPRRPLQLNKTRRWLNNLGLVACNTLLLRLVFPTAAVGVAALAGEQGWGLLNQLRPAYGISVLISIVALDLIIYFQHVLFHAVPLLWRLHMVHHADMDYDVTTGLRFHPLEILLSMLIKMAAILVLGPPVTAVILFEILLNASSMFNHGNLRLPAKVDALLRLLIVTPDMHRVHHSTIKRETNSNYGFNLSLWDRIFGTYRAQPQLGHEGMTIGLDQFRDPKQQALYWLLLLPLVGKVGAYPINRNEEENR
jgi:sterol desaturase/sphingolipid hydroxylase (fatty acid hydroxylase superfamily)